MQNEINSLFSSGTLDIVLRKEGINTVASKWVYKVKYLPNRQIDKYKSRLVTKGYT